MARPEHTDVRARYSLLSVDLPALAKGGSWYQIVESFGFWRRKFCIRNVEILTVGKIAEFAKFAGGKRRKSPDRFCFIYPGQRRGYCWREEDWRSDGVQRSGTEAEWQSSDSLCPLGQVFGRLVRLKSWPGFNVQRWRQRVFEDLLAVLEVSPVRWG